MNTANLGPDALIQLFAEATTWQSQALRRMVSETTQQAAQSRASMFANVCRVRATERKGTTVVAAQDPPREIDFEDC